MAVGDFFQTHLQLATQDRQWRIGYAYRQIAGGNPANLSEHVNSGWTAAFTMDIRAIFSDEVELQCLYTSKVRVAAGIPDTFNFPAQAGLNPGAAMPNDSPFVIKVLTNSLTSKANGRQFISGYTDDVVIDGDLDPVFVAGPLATYMTDIITNITSQLDLTIVFEPGVISRFFLGIKLPTPVFNLASFAVTDGFIKSQQRRRTRQTVIA